MKIPKGLKQFDKSLINLKWLSGNIERSECISLHSRNRLSNVFSSERYRNFASRTSRSSLTANSKCSWRLRTSKTRSACYYYISNERKNRCLQFSRPSGVLLQPEMACRDSQRRHGKHGRKFLREKSLKIR